MLEFFVVTSFWLFWGLAVLEVVLLSAFVHSERYGSAWLAFIAGWAAFYLFGMFDAGGCYHAVVQHPMVTVRGIAQYATMWLGFGLVYATIRLTKFIYARKSAYIERKASFFSPGRLDPKTTDGKKEWHRWLTQSQDFRDIKYDLESDTATVLVSMHKGRIAAWTSYWLFSLIGWIAGDMLADVGKWLVDAFGGLYQKLADNIMKGA